MLLRRVLPSDGIICAAHPQGSGIFEVCQCFETMATTAYNNKLDFVGCLYSHFIIILITIHRYCPFSFPGGRIVIVLIHLSDTRSYREHQT